MMNPNYEFVHKIILFSNLFVILSGLIGNLSTFLVFIQSRFRRNSTNIFLLVLAINDFFYLIFYFIDDSIITIQYTYEIKMNFISDTLNDLKLYHLIKYVRYVLRNISSYTVVIFTIQRLMLVYRPFSYRLKSKKSAWKLIFVIIFLSITSNIWILYKFNLENNFGLILAYIIYIILIPVLIILCSNIILIINLFKNNTIILNISKSTTTESMNRLNNNQTTTTTTTPINRPYYLSFNQFINKIALKANNPKHLTKMLLFISITYGLLNLQYLIVWSAVYQINSKLKNNDDQMNIHTIYLRISELIYLINFSMNFYIYCLSGSVFRKQLQYSCNIILFIFKIYIINIFFNFKSIQVD